MALLITIVDTVGARGHQHTIDALRSAAARLPVEPAGASRIRRGLTRRPSRSSSVTSHSIVDVTASGSKRGSEDATDAEFQPKRARTLSDPFHTMQVCDLAPFV